MAQSDRVCGARTSLRLPFLDGLACRRTDLGLLAGQACEVTCCPQNRLRTAACRHSSCHAIPRPFYRDVADIGVMSDSNLRVYFILDLLQSEFRALGPAS